MLNTCVNQSIDHVVLLVGWTKDGWIIRNSWGTNWGDNGYAVISYKNNCGIPKWMDILIMEPGPSTYNSSAENVEEEIIDQRTDTTTDTTTDTKTDTKTDTTTDTNKNTDTVNTTTNNTIITNNTTVQNTTNITDNTTSNSSNSTNTIIIHDTIDGPTETLVVTMAD